MPPDDHQANQQTARQIETQHPGWIVIWGAYSRQYVAFPLFPSPGGTILTAAYPPALMARMQAAGHHPPGQTPLPGTGQTGTPGR